MKNYQYCTTTGFPGENPSLPELCIETTWKLVSSVIYCGIVSWYWKREVI